MKILVLGPTGAAGRVVVEVALAQGHTVTALARDAGELTIEDPKLRVVQGDVLRPLTLDGAMAGQDAVLFCVGPGASGQAAQRTDAARHTVASMTQAGVKRLVALSGLGAGASRKSQGFFFDKIAAPLWLRGVLADQNGMEAEIRKSKLAWVVVRPGQMNDLPAKGKWVISLDGTNVTREVSRRDVALFMLAQLESDEYVGRAPAIGY